MGLAALAEPGDYISSHGRLKSLVMLADAQTARRLNIVEVPSLALRLTTGSDGTVCYWYPGGYGAASQGDGSALPASVTAALLPWGRRYGHGW